MDRALALHKETTLQLPGAGAGDTGGLLAPLAPVFDSAWPGMLHQFEHSIAADFAADVLGGLVYRPYRDPDARPTPAARSLTLERLPKMTVPGWQRRHEVVVARSPQRPARRSDVAPLFAAFGGGATGHNSLAGKSVTALPIYACFSDPSCFAIEARFDGSKTIDVASENRKRAGRS